MDVHSHTHTARKKWAHYFWEFLMLFLAVIAGFYAENIREHRVEARRGKAYLQSFTADLKADTANYAALLNLYDKKSAGLRDFYSCYLSPKYAYFYTHRTKFIIAFLYLCSGVSC